MANLFEPVQLGAIHAPNRVLMAPLTRARATRDHVPTPIMADYYRQRASAGLIISEGIGVSRQGLGWPYAAGLWSAEQVEGWKLVTAAVHEAGGRIFAQLWHMGRLVHSSMTGEQPISSSPVTAPGHAHSYDGNKPYEQPRALGIEEIPALVQTYVTAARNAIEAGFDGVQIHGANGYLIDEFLRDGVNRREDAYGGPPENRVRLLREITQAVADAIGADRTAVRLSLNGDSQGTDDSDPASLSLAVAQALDPIGLAFLELRELRTDGTRGASDVPRQSPLIRQHYRGPLVLNSDYDAARAQADLDSGLAQAISFGRPFISNPDLPERLSTGAPLSPLRQETLYTQGAEGYVDYPALEKVA
ncbi:alkene reductase [Sphingobium sp. TA15]|uniref:2,4-dienoyl-CoA reductase (NADPH2) n=1 Tax=Sphingobium indicum (strain DSM 16413 / CCM 7287 / MTCC 6362 / UT26 / NBRC 101211 / UT26S) TaxID=452662 RepID=D4YXP7_SPHIU|nr:alkene reductase [Sphingobium indicum]BAI95129.1 2,4-dienoyl-CoA reductase (NADPH2) [Sphingobium indicum UT26S]BDD68008.1 alkene reductase [Sphingobium sp. TA15]